MIFIFLELDPNKSTSPNNLSNQKKSYRQRVKRRLLVRYHIRALLLPHEKNSMYIPSHSSPRNNNKIHVPLFFSSSLFVQTKHWFPRGMHCTAQHSTAQADDDACICQANEFFQKNKEKHNHNVQHTGSAYDNECCYAACHFLVQKLKYRRYAYVYAYVYAYEYRIKMQCWESCFLDGMHISPL
jgi:hypothetical protein